MWHRKRRQFSHEYWGVLLGIAVILSSMSGCYRYVAPSGLPTHPEIGMSALETVHAEQSHVVARASIEVSHLLGTEKVNANVVLRPPGDLRLELLTPTDDLIAIFVANKSETRMFQRGADECLVQVGCQGNLEGLLPVPILVSDLVSLLLGGGPLYLSTREPMTWNDMRGTLVLSEEESPAGKRIVHLDPCSFEVVEVEWWKNENLSVRAAVGDTQTVRFVVPEEGIEVTMTFVVRDDEMEVEDDAFTFQCPGGVTEQVVRCVQKESTHE